MEIPSFEVELSTPAECQAPAKFDYMVLWITTSTLYPTFSQDMPIKLVAFEPVFPFLHGQPWRFPSSYEVCGPCQEEAPAPEDLGRQSAAGRQHRQRGRITAGGGHGVSHVICWWGFHSHWGFHQGKCEHTKIEYIYIYMIFIFIYLYIVYIIYNIPIYII